MSLPIDGDPRCPVCGLTTSVEPNRSKNRDSTGAYWCGNCSTTFNGTSGEWSANAKRRWLWAETIKARDGGGAS